VISTLSGRRWASLGDERPQLSRVERDARLDHGLGLRQRAHIIHAFVRFRARLALANSEEMLAAQRPQHRDLLARAQSSERATRNLKSDVLPSASGEAAKLRLSSSAMPSEPAGQEQ
jgi:hypothetical protein